MISTIYSFSYIPSLILCGLGVFVLLAWVFGTDMYDSMEGGFDDSDFATFCIVHMVCSIISTFLWFTFKDVEFIWFICCAWNTWLAFLLFVSFFFISLEVLSSFRNYCLKKRGKK